MWRGRVSFEVALTVVLVAILLLQATSLIALQWYRSGITVRTAALTFMDHVAAENANDTVAILAQQTLPTLQQLSALPELTRSTSPDVEAAGTALADKLVALPNLY